MKQTLAPDELQALRSSLQTRRTTLTEQQRGHLAGQSRAEHAREVLLQDGDDAPQRDADREVDLATTDREVVDLAAIDAALQRLDQGVFGQCAGCGEPMALARLRLTPHALRCVACETALEKLQAKGQPRPASM